ncbi:MAG TPA: peptidase M48 [Noviherbaspirillum sp.]|uniref:peptidase M48 n=1 Tax=Noviherbaspirillum sp. TaxID=1926288 RepID=UPI002B464133|nr:peptidase M48 [Noviherbaspirillum sp.]HJV86630.1 peptidase M48 [Noviherbaspirillum sp.]
MESLHVSADAQRAASWPRRWCIAAPLVLLSACAMQPPAPRPAPLPPSRPPVTVTPVPPPQPVPPPPATPAIPPPQPALPSPQPAPETPAVTPSATPAPDKATALQAWVDQQDRLYKVAAPLLIGNTELCERHVRQLLGFTAKNQYSYTDELADVAHNALGLNGRLHIMSVLPGSGAEQAGLRKGDILLAAGIDPLPDGPEAEHEAASLIRGEMQGRSNISLTVLRDGERIPLDVPLTSACAMAVDLGDSDRVNAWADGNRVLVTRGMLNSTRSDAELAYVLAKEIALNILMPSERKDAAAVIDRLRVPVFDNTGMAPPGEVQGYQPAIESRADTLSLYLLARAGYDIEHAPAFWKRLAETYPEQFSSNATVMEETIRVIKDKVAQNQPLVPEELSGAPAAQ